LEGNATRAALTCMVEPQRTKKGVCAERERERERESVCVCVCDMEGNWLLTIKGRNLLECWKGNRKYVQYVM
jgi:hypothetical protein